MGHGVCSYLVFCGCLFLRKSMVYHIICNSLLLVKIARIQDLSNPSIPKSRIIRLILRLAPVMLYFAIVVGCYATVLSKGGTRSIGSGLPEIVRIPMILYLMMVLTALVALGMLSVTRVCATGMNENNVKNNNETKPQGESGKNENSVEVGDGTLHSSTATTNGKKSYTNNDASENFATVATIVVPLVVCYTIMVAISVYFETAHVKLDLFILMIILITVFTLLALVSMVFMENSLGRTALGPPQLPEQLAQQQILENIENKELPSSN